eukprot:4966994-Amphidinium_carterae.1
MHPLPQQAHTNSRTRPLVSSLPQLCKMNKHNMNKFPHVVVTSMQINNAPAALCSVPVPGSCC